MKREDGATDGMQAHPGGTHALHALNARLAEQFLDALLSADRASALHLAVQAVRHGQTVADVHLHLVQLSMARIGALWRDGRISVATEHTATAIAQYVVTRLYPMMARDDPWRGHVVVAGVAGEQHQLGGHLVSDALEADGWAVQFLGADCPRDDILAACRETQSQVLALSCTMPANLPEVGSIISAARSALSGGAPIRVLVGGQAFGTGRHAHSHAVALGADGLARDLMEAVVIARTWSRPEIQRPVCAQLRPADLTEVQETDLGR